MADGADQFVETATKMLRDGEITLDDIKRLGASLRKERVGYIDIPDPDWEELPPSKKDQPEPVKTDGQSEKDPSSPGKTKAEQESESARDKELMEKLMAVAMGKDKKPKKSKKVMAREKIVQEVRAMQQQQKADKEKSGRGGRGSNGKGSSSEEEKKEMPASQKSKSTHGGGGEKDGGSSVVEGGRRKLKTIVKITSKRQVSGGKSEEAQSGHALALTKKSTKEELAGIMKEKMHYEIPEGGEEVEKLNTETTALFYGRVVDFKTFLKKSEQTKGLEPTGPPRLSYKVLLRCMSRDMEETKILDCYKIPKTGADIKSRIERAFQIPHSFQGDLSFNGKTIDDGTSLARIGLRPGALMEMTYLCEAQVEEVRVVVEWFHFMTNFKLYCHYNAFSGYPTELWVVAVQGINQGIPRILVEEYLVPPDDKTKYANRVYFLQQSGHLLLLELYDKLLWQSWRTMWLPFKFAETDCILVLAALGCGNETRKILVKNDAHGYVLQSFLRVPVSRFKSLEDTSGSPGSAEQNNYILKCLLENAVKFLFNFRDNSELHMDICSRSSVVDQLIAISHCTTFSIEVAQDCMCVLACCMHSPDSHKYFCRNPTLEGIVDCTNSHKNKGECPDKQLQLLHYYTQVILSHLVMSSGKHMSIKATNKIVNFMTNFLKDLDPQEVHDLEQERHKDLGWSVFFPYIKPLLSPLPKVDIHRCAVDQTLQSALYDNSIETLLFTLQVMCSGDPNIPRRNLMDEKLLGYIFCLPSNVPDRLQERARSLCSVLRKDSVKPVPLPKLNIIARAKLAVMSVGLKKAMDRNAKDLQLELNPTLRTHERHTLY